jgi:hypothetical protein
MSRPAKSRPTLTETDPVMWFARLERAVREKDFLIAVEAQRHLSRSGWDVVHVPGRKLCKRPQPRQTAAGQGGNQ